MPAVTAPAQLAPDVSPQPTTTALWRDSLPKRIAAAIARPLVYALNRPALARFNAALFDLALRLNGIAINFHGRHGLSLGEERLLARRLRREETGVLLDVGANAGGYTRLLATLCPAARVFAFEPHPATFRRLSETDLARAGKVQLVNCALSAVEGRMNLHDFADGDGSTQASLSGDAVGLFSSRTVSHKVAVTTIDAFMATNGIAEIAFLKIDTEGHDIEVLRGAKAAIGRRAIRMIQFEFIPANVATRVFMRDFFDALPGYKLYRLCLNGDLLPLFPYNVKRCEVFVTHNLVALPA